MHERNKYREPPDFKKLAEKYSEFAKHVHVSGDGKGHLNFKDPEAVRELTYTLLKEDFSISLDVPLDRLIPTLPLRLNYIHWIEDLIDGGCKLGSEVRGIDIGCGASCIYPLLGCCMNEWHFTASEIDELSFDYAAKNIQKNNFDKKIQLKRGTMDGILKGLIGETEQFDFCMCNPPFFSDREEAIGDNSRTGRRPLPFSICTATDGESITEGGEVEFVKKMLEESLELKNKIRWFTSMLGKKKSLNSLKHYVKELKIPFVAYTSFQQGKTTRWGICWSFHDVPKVQSLQLSKKKAKINTSPFSFNIPKSELETKSCVVTDDADQIGSMLKSVCHKVAELLKNLQITSLETPEAPASTDSECECHFVGKAFQNTWSHQRRRKRDSKKQMQTAESDSCGSSSNLDTGVKNDKNNKGDNRDSCGSLSSQDTGVKNDKNNKGDNRDSCVSLSSQDTDGKNDKNNKGDNRDSCGNSLRENIDDSDCKGRDTNKSIKTGQKRSHEEMSKCDSEPDFLFKFRLDGKSNKDTPQYEKTPLRIDVSCLEGNREGVHQLFMYFRNHFNGTQVK